MNLLMYLHSLEAGGAERVAANLANYWASQGWRVTIATVESAERDFYWLDPAVRRISFGMAGNSASLREALARNLSCISMLRQMLREMRPDAVMALMTNANILLSMACLGLPAVCAVGSEHTYPACSPLGTLWRQLRRISYRGLHAVVALTPECADWILCNTSAVRSPVIPNPAGWPLPVQMPIVSPNTVCRPGRRIMLGVGRLSKEKNFEVLINAYGELGQSHQDWDLVIVGSGPEQERLGQQVKSLGLCDRVFLPGVVGNVGEWYLSADLYAMTSLREGFPNTLAEAMAHGLPAVSFDCDTGPRDIIRHALDGLLVAPGDMSALKQALDRLMGDTALRRRLAERAIDARERFSIERIAGLWEALFREGASVSQVNRGMPSLNVIK